MPSAIITIGDLVEHNVGENLQLNYKCHSTYSDHLVMMRARGFLDLEYG